MKQAQWTLHDAKNKFSAVVSAAQAGCPQLVTKRGVLAAVVVSVEEYQEYLLVRKKKRTGFAEYLLSIPRSDIEFERMQTGLRDFEI